MQNLRKQLPPLELLVAFEAAARLLSFTRAAAELEVTQAAVSQQIRNLERRLGVALFERVHRAVRLTPVGREFQHTVSLALTHLANTTREIRAADGSALLTVATDVAVAALWLMPRLPGFQRSHPHLRLRLVASDDDADCLAEGIDVAIVHGTGEWPGFDAVTLFADEAFPVCSPAYLATHPALTGADTLAGQSLLELDDEHWDWMNWRIWLTEQGVDLPAGQRRLHVNSYPLLIDAARAGQGVALGWRHLVDDALHAGTLCAPLTESVQTPLSYHLLIRTGSRVAPEALPFRDWLLDQRDRQPLFELGAGGSAARGRPAPGHAVIGELDGEAGSLFHAMVGTEHVTHPRGAARVRVPEREGSA